MISNKHILTILSLIILAANMTQAKSVYVINDTYALEMQAYKVEDANLVYQIDYHFVSEDWGPVGLAIDESEYGQFLFATYESGNEIELVNAKTMAYVDTVTATGASSLAGIVVDQGKQKLYVVGRGTKYLYVYNWDPNIPELVQDGNRIELEGLVNELVGGAWGLALDEQNHRLYITSNQTKVRFYDTNDWSHDPNTDYITVSHDAVGVAVDVNAYVYTGSGFYGTLLSQYDLSAETEDTVDIGSPVLGIAVDQATGLIYLTTYGDGDDTYYQDPPQDRLMIYDSNLTKQPWESGDIGNPAGVAVGSTAVYKPPAFYLEKVDVNEPNCVLPGDYITYKITYGPNGVDHNNVVITDYLPCQVDYINPFDPNYDDANHTYKWQIGSLSASAPNDFVTLTVYVNLGVEPNGIITNYCEIESVQYLSFASADTNVCFWSPDIIYVDVNAVGCNSGLSWYHADPNLQRALQKAQAWDVNQIWVAEGMHKPTTRSDTDARLISFELLDNVAIYGGFPPGGGQWANRDPNAYETILSGDIGTPIDQNDNSYHIVKCEDVNNAILDGFTITAGNADGSEANGEGGGIYCEDSNGLMVTNCAFSGNLAISGGGMFNEQSSPTLINCTFNGNTVYSPYNSYGGAICNLDHSNPNVTNCTFSGNSAITTGEYSSYGGAICNWDYSNPNVTNCTFSGNSATNTWGGNTYGGAICNWIYSNPNVTNCTFIGNSATSTYGDSYGGGICNWYYSNPNLTNCTFSGNSATTTEESSYGGAIFNWNHSNPNVTNCIFSGNSATTTSDDSYGGAICNWDYSNPNITNCTFCGNSATSGIYNSYGGGICNDQSSPTIISCTFSNNSAREGGAVYNYDHSDPDISNCIFGGNDANNFGGGMVNSNESSPTIINCTFIGNSATTVGDSYGGAMCNWNDSGSNVTNCTFSNNSAYVGGGVYNNGSDPNITNCILWDNEATVEDEIYNYLSDPNISYSDIKEGWIGTGNIDEDPCFFVVEPSTGSWTEDASYDSSTFQSTLTNDYASWAVNQLAGKFVNPDKYGGYLQFFIVSNDVNTIKVWSDVNDIAKATRTYQIYDYHLKLDSACIDAGDPNGDYTGQKDIDGEPRVFDGDADETEIVDMGADEYYWSPADFNSDGLVNFFDYSLFAGAWLTVPTDQHYNDVYDLVDNNCIDSNDLARFCEDWLWQTAWAKTFPYAYGQGLGRGMGKSMGESLGFTGALFPSASAKQPRPELTAADIEQIIKWLQELWLTDDEVRKVISEDEWLEFMEAVMQALKQLTYN